MLAKTSRDMPAEPIPTEIRHERIAADGVELHVARAGAGPPVILLHGFPESWRSWKHQIPALASAGFSCCYGRARPAMLCVMRGSSAPLASSIVPSPSV